MPTLSTVLPKEKSADNIAALITKFSFPGSCLVYREPGERYEHIVESILPDILIENDCKSIGGAWQMCITKVSPTIKCRIKSIVVPEFKGIDSLSEDINKLMENCCSTI